MALLSFAAHAAAQTSWTYCAGENSQCGFSGTKEVRYGANGSYAYLIYSNGVACSNNIFGDPLYGTFKQCDYRDTTISTSSTTSATSNWTYCASENSQCSFSGTKEVRYGINGAYFYGTHFNGVACSNNIFGDPIYGSTKQCHYRDTTTSTSSTTSNWTYCASENSQCSFSGTKEVRYGINGAYFYGTYSNGVACSNNVFGDPIYGSAKQCDYRDSTISTSTTPPSTLNTTSSTTSATSNWTYCASENNQCSFSGTKEVRYGINGAYFYGTYSNGVACSNNVFGDPIYGSAKQCDYRDTTSTTTTTTSTTSTPITTTTSTNGITYFVATGGSDSYTCTQARSSSTPKRTISAALACVGPAGSPAGAGITVQVATGVYAESVDRLPSGSSSSNQFTLKCATFRACTIRAGNRPAITMYTPSSYLEIRGFVLDGQNYPAAGGVYASAYNLGDHHHVRIVDNELKNLGDHGIVVTGASHWQIQNNWIHHVGASCYSPGLCHAIYVADNTENWLIEQNTINNATAYGIHVYASVGGHVIRYNITHSNGTPGVNGSGILTGGYGGQVYGNLSYGNADAGIFLGNGCSNLIAYNNTVYNNHGFGMYVDCGGSTVKNNLVVANSPSPMFMAGSGITSSNNVVSGTAASHFVNATTGDFNLTTSSSAINAGTVSISSGITVDSYLGAAPDAGAIERQ